MARHEGRNRHGPSGQIDLQTLNRFILMRIGQTFKLDLLRYWGPKIQLSAVATTFEHLPPTAS